MRVISVVVAVALLAGSCGGEPSLSDYADDVEELVVTMNFGLDTLDSLVDHPNPSLEDVQTYAADRMDIREAFLTGIKDLQPPERVQHLHDAVLDLMTRLATAESAMADEVLALDEGADLSNLWESESGRTARAIDAEAVAFCKAAEAELDTGGQTTFGDDLLWIPSEMAEVVRVAFYCDRSDRP
ncbi:MAG: hypothetical protein GY722_26330 [bacterium]|nr:hypothetical protein [bacterium]